MGNQRDWVQIQADKHKRLLDLRESVRQAILADEGYSQSAIRVGLIMIRRHHGERAEAETRRMFNLKEEAA